MLYGHMEMVDNRVATLVTSGDTIEEYDAFLNVVRNQDMAKRNFNEMYTSKALQHMVEELYKGFKKPIHVFYHNDEAQRDAFVTEWNVKVLENGVQSRDKQGDMVFEKKLREENSKKQQRDAAQMQAEAAGIEYTGEREKTLAEMFNLQENDPWDRRSEDEVEYDREMKKQMQAAKAAGTMSDDSFTQPEVKADDDAAKSPNGQLTITDTDGIINPDGTLNISNIRAVKTGGPVDENLKQARQQAYEDKKQELLGERKQFSPDDFAAVLSGDGSADHLGVRGDRDVRNGVKPIERPSLSQAAEEARADIKNAEQAAMEQTRIENDFKAQQERNKGVFRGADLFGEDELDWDDADAALREELERLGAKSEVINSKDYPFNSQLGSKSVLPFDGWGPAMFDPTNPSPVTAIIGTVNVTVEGTMTMGNTAAAVVSRTDESRDGWVIYQRVGGNLGTRVVTSVVKIR